MIRSPVATVASGALFASARSACGPPGGGIGGAVTSTPADASSFVGFVSVVVVVTDAFTVVWPTVAGPTSASAIGGAVAPDASWPASWHTTRLTLSEHAQPPPAAETKP